MRPVRFLLRPEDQADAFRKSAQHPKGSEPIRFNINCLISLKVDPFYDPLRGDPRFQDLLRRTAP